MIILHYPTTDGTSHYVIFGGWNYAMPEHPALDPRPIAPEGSRDYRNFDHYATLADAVYAWCARRNDWSGRFPLWGDGCDGPEWSPIGWCDASGDLVEVWTLAEAFEAAGIVDDADSYFDGGA